jgi:hypothetical protein
MYCSIQPYIVLGYSKFSTRVPSTHKRILEAGKSTKFFDLLKIKYQIFITGYNTS